MIETAPIPGEVKTPAEEEGAVFNGSLATLERIHNLIVDITRYDVNFNLLGYRNNLKELYFESRGFLDKKERVQARNTWEKIKGLKCVVDHERGTSVYAPELPDLLDLFNSWLRLRLHRHNVTMAKKDLMNIGVNFQRRRYKLG